MKYIRNPPKKTALVLPLPPTVLPWAAEIVGLVLLHRRKRSRPKNLPPLKPKALAGLQTGALWCRHRTGTNYPGNLCPASSQPLPRLSSVLSGADYQYRQVGGLQDALRHRA